MNDLKNDIKNNGLTMDLGLFDADTMDPNLGCRESCLFGCSGGCWSTNVAKHILQTQK